MLIITNSIDSKYCKQRPIEKTLQASTDLNFVQFLTFKGLKWSKRELHEICHTFLYLQPPLSRAIFYFPLYYYTIQ